MVNEERAHWLQVLSNDPDNREAQERLHMRWFMGRLLTNFQIDAVKQHNASEAKQLKQWTPVVLRWQRAIERGSQPEQAQAISEMASTNDPAVIPVLERVAFVEGSRQSEKTDSGSSFQSQAIALLGRLPQQRATYSLTVIAVLSSQAGARVAATDELKKRPLHDFVPLLLDQLADPIEFSIAANYDVAGGLAYYRAVAQQEGPDSIRKIEDSATVAGTNPATVLISGLISSHFTHVPPTISLLHGIAPDLGPIPAAVTQGKYVAAQIERQNAQIQLLNNRINAVLKRVTSNSAAGRHSEEDSEVIPDAAMATPTAEYWWNRWADYNEAYRVYEKPLESMQRSVAKFTPDKTFFSSCFPAGTPVITQLGPTPIEKLEIGDRVLSQDQDSGELCFKPVLGTTIRPPADMLEVATAAGKIRLTKGHPFWIVGKGWRMAKELQSGDRVHTLHGSEMVEAVAPADAAAAYNLIVADFGTYFVGPAPILVHDNSRRLPTRVGVPGLAKSP